MLTYSVQPFYGKKFSRENSFARKNSQNSWQKASHIPICFANFSEKPFTTEKNVGKTMMLFSKTLGSFTSSLINDTTIRNKRMTLYLTVMATFFEEGHLLFQIVGSKRLNIGMPNTQEQKQRENLQEKLL